MMNINKLFSVCQNLVYQLFWGLPIPESRKKYLRLFVILFWLYPTYGCLYIRKFVLSSGRKVDLPRDKSNRYVSFITMTEGIGSMICRQITALILSRMFNLTYVHRPFPRTFHSPQCDWEKFLGFGEGEIKYEDIANHKALKVVHLPEFDIRYYKQLQLFLLNTIINRIYGNTNTLFIVTRYSFFPPSEAQSISEPIVCLLRKKYQQSRGRHPVKNVFDGEKLKVAVLVRKSDIAYNVQDIQTKWRWTDIAWHISVLKKINEIYNGQRVDIRVFSNEKEENISEFKIISNATLHLQKDDMEQQPFQAFHAMVTADILVCWNSAFSYIPGLLSNGVKIIPPDKYETMWLPKDRTWLSSDSKGNFNIGALSKYKLCN